MVGGLNLAPFMLSQHNTDLENTHVSVVYVFRACWGKVDVKISLRRDFFLIKYLADSRWASS